MAKSKNDTIVYKISDNLKKEIIDHYKETTRDTKPPYSVFQSYDAGTVVTLYESGKIMFQGVSADIDYMWWRDRERKMNDRDLDREIAFKNARDRKKKEKEAESSAMFKNVSTIGSDEVGTGDYFGPIVVTASYVSASDISFVEDLGVRDCKKLTDEKILDIAPKLIKRIPFVSYTLTPYEYNKVGITNMNKVKAILHNKVLSQLLKKDNYEYKYIVVDQFSLVSKYFEHIKDVPDKVMNISFTTHAEDKCLSVAVSSIISRYVFLNEMNKMSEKYGIEIPKGAGEKVDAISCEFVNKFGEKELFNAVKLNFKNTEKIKEALK